MGCEPVLRTTSCRMLVKCRIEGGRHYIGARRSVQAALALLREADIVQAVAARGIVRVTWVSTPAILLLVGRSPFDVFAEPLRIVYTLRGQSGPRRTRSSLSASIFRAQKPVLERHQKSDESVDKRRITYSPLGSLARRPSRPLCLHPSKLRQRPRAPPIRLGPSS